jgi:aspartyl-tRNA synthetase
VLRGVFEEFGGGKLVTPKFPMIPYREAMLKYGTDKPDLRNPLLIADVTAEFARDDVTFNAFKNVIKSGGVVRAIPAPGAAAQPRSFFDKLNDWARGEGAPGLGYIVLEEGDEIGHEEWVEISGRLQAMSEDADETARELAHLRRLAGRGPIAKFIPREVLIEIAVKAGVKPGDAVFFACDQELKAAKLAGAARTRIGTELGFSSPACLNSAGLSISRCTNGTRTRRRSTSRTTRSRCRRADLRRLRRRTRSTYLPSNTTSSATASNYLRARSAIIVPTS